jgi:hypothetical protein
MKIEKWVLRMESSKEAAMVYVAEADICLDTVGQFRGIINNPVLGHAAFATLCAAFQNFHVTDAKSLWDNLHLSTFFFSFENGEIEPCHNQMAFAEVVEDLKKQGTHTAALYRNKRSVEQALEDEPDLDLKPYVLCLQEWVAEMYRLEPFIKEKATA